MGDPNSEESFQKLQQFVKTQDEFNEAFACLKKSAEIGLVVGDIRGVLKCVDNQVELLKENATKADVEFNLSLKAATDLSLTQPKNMGQLGIEVLKAVAAQEVRIRVVGRVFSVLTGGYLGIIKKAGPEFMSFLASKGFKSIGKISQAIKNMKTS